MSKNNFLISPFSLPLENKVFVYCEKISELRAG
jgi:hypothetical protein